MNKKKESTCERLMNTLMLVCRVSSTLTSTHLFTGSPPPGFETEALAAVTFMASKGGRLKTPFCDAAVLLTLSLSDPTWALLGKGGGTRASKSAGVMDPAPASMANHW